MQMHNRSEQILRPPNYLFILLTLSVALLANFLPTRTWPSMPDWVALILCIWTIREFRLVGMGTAFALGILMDVADATVLGQHALAYVILVFGAGGLSRRVLWFPLHQQALHVFPLLLVPAVVQSLIRYLAGDGLPDPMLFVGPVISAALWKPFTLLLLIPQLRPHERDENRPI